MSVKVAIVGATGVVGQEMIERLGDYFPDDKLDLLKIASRNRPEQNVYALDESWERLRDYPYILNASSGDAARQIKEHLSPQQVLIDNSSAFRMDKETPLVVPEINAHLCDQHNGVIANPNCTCILLCCTLNPLKKFGIERVLVSTYQAASGAGIKGLEELCSQDFNKMSEQKPLPKAEVFGFPLMGNVISHNSDIITDNTHPGVGYNDEEWKVVEEARKILGQADLDISATCMRVPVKRAHTESVTVDLKNSPTDEEMQALLATSPGLKLINDLDNNHFPMPLESENQDLVFVGRIRKDSARPNTWHYILSGDQLRKGAATNAVQILKHIHK